MDVLNDMNERFAGVEKLCHDTADAVGRVSKDLADVLRRLDAAKPEEDLSSDQGISDAEVEEDDPHAPPSGGTAHLAELRAPRGSVCATAPAEGNGGPTLADAIRAQAEHRGDHAAEPSESERKESQVTFGKAFRPFSQRRSSEGSQTSCTGAGHGGAVGRVAGKMRRSSDWIATLVKSLNRGSYHGQEFQGGQERASSTADSLSRMSRDRVSRISQWHNLSRGRDLAAKEVMNLADDSFVSKSSHFSNLSNRMAACSRSACSRLDQWWLPMLNPHSSKLQAWELLVGLCVSYVALLVPMQVAFSERFPEEEWTSFNMFLDIVFILDILVQFRTGYYLDGICPYPVYVHCLWPVGAVAVRVAGRLGPANACSSADRWSPAHSASARLRLAHELERRRTRTGYQDWLLAVGPSQRLRCEMRRR